MIHYKESCTQYAYAYSISLMFQYSKTQVSIYNLFIHALGKT